MTWLCKSFPIKSKITCENMDQWDFLGSWTLVGNLGFWVFWPFPCRFISLFSLVQHGTSMEVTTSGIPQVSNKFLFAPFFFFFLTILHIVQTVSDPKNLFIFFFISFSIFRLLSSNLWLFDFLFLFSFLFFCGDSSVLSSKGKGRNSYPGLSFMVEKLRFGSKRLVEGSTWCMLGSLFSKWFMNKGMPQITSMTRT